MESQSDRGVRMADAVEMEKTGKLTGFFMAALVVILVAGSVLTWVEYREQMKDAQTRLQSVASMKISQIADWRSERLADAAVMAERTGLVRDAKRFLETGDSGAGAETAHRLNSMADHYGYHDILLVDRTGEVRFSLTDIPHESAITELVSALFPSGSGSPIFAPLHHEDVYPFPHLSILAPLSGEGDSGPPFGYLVLVSDAKQFLYPLVQSWPVPTDTAETLLVRREGDHVLFLNELRHRKDTALKLTIVLTREDLPAVMAVNGQTGVVRGRDYRGEPVLAVLERIPDSDWFMVAKIDRSEALAEWWDRLPLMLLLMGGAVLLAGAMALTFHQRALKHRYRRQFLGEARLRQAAEREAVTLASIGDAVISTDKKGRVMSMNPVAEELTGWTRTEAVGRPLEDVFRIINEDTRQKVENPVTRVLRERTVVGLANHTLLITKDGREISIADSGAPIRDETGTITGVVLVFRDQTEERMNERIIRTRLELIEYAYTHTFDEVLQKALDEVGNLVASPVGFYHFLAEDQKTLTLQQWSTRTLEEFCKADFKGAHYDVDKAGIWVDCVRERKPVIHNDYASEPHRRGLPDGHAHLIRELVVPVMRHDRIVAILGVGNKPTDYDQRDVEIVSYLADVTWEIVSLKRTEHQMVQQQEYRRAILGASPLPVFSLDPEGIVQFWNEAAERVFGWTAEEVEGRVLPIVPEDGQEEFAALRKRVLSGESLFGLEITRSKRNGDPIDLRLSTTPVRDERGYVTGIMAVTEDITGEKEAEQQIERLGRVLEDSLNEVYLFDADTLRFTYVNASAQRNLGYGMEDLVGMTPLDLKSEMAPEQFADTLAPLLDGREEKVEFETVHRRKDGSLYDVEVHLQLLESGSERLFSAIILDITARKQAETAVRESEERFRHLFEYSPVGINMTSPDGHIRANRAFYRMLGCEENPENLNWRDITHPDDVEKSQAVVDALLRGEMETARFTKRYQHRDGSDVWADVSVALRRDEAGNPLHFMTAVLDTTALKQAEMERESLQEQLVQSQKMESVGRLAGGVAHDFNNMLGVIMGRAEMQLMRMGKDDPVRESMESVLSAAKRSADLTRQLLAFARKQTISPKILDLNETVEGMLKMLRRLIGEDMDLVWEPGRNTRPVYMDPAQLDQILVNLCVNARDAIEDVGKITIETEHVGLDDDYCAVHAEARPGAYTLVAVSDNGCGMDEETRLNIFEPFFTTKGEGKGTGLGLSTVYGIVKQNNGFINVYSEPGRGTTFRIYIPIHKGEPGVEAEAAVLETPRGNGETILLVEDEPVLLDMTCSMLEELGYNVIPVDGPSPALDEANKPDCNPDLVITDVVMPGMNGRELAETLLQDCPDMKILFMSGYTPNTIVHHGVLDKGVHFIQKPFSMHDLGVKVRDVLAGGR